ncbi:MAG TPA: transcriptional regulator, partial [Bradyrhizobium sp.]|nr:transcriptional regulator [Bradyrhizobium sp.]
LRQWSEEFAGKPDGFPTLLVDRGKGRPVRKLELRSEDGRLLGIGDTDVRPNSGVKRRRRVLA